MTTSGFAQTPAGAPKRRYAIIGTGVRGIGMWGRPMLTRYADHVEFVGLCDINPKRAELAKAALRVSCPTFDNFDKMCDAVKPELLTVTTVDRFHAEYIVKALDRGIDVITEKPMVTDEAQVKQVLDAEARNKRKIVVGFNYRFAPKHVKIKEIIQSGDDRHRHRRRLPLVSRHVARRRLLPPLAPPARRTARCGRTRRRTTST